MYYIFVKGHPRSFLELIQLLGRLKRGNGVRVMKDKLHILLSLPNFVSVLFTVLSHEDDKERVRQLNELRTVTEIILRRDACFECMTDEYYGNSMLLVQEDCGGCCPKCRGEKSRVVKRSFLVDHMEALVFDNGPVNVGPLSVKIL